MSDYCYDVTGPLNTSQLNSVAERHNATTLQSSGSAGNADSNQDPTLCERHSNELVLVYTVDSSYTAVDVFHAYCALAVVRHRLSSSQCTMNCCKDELSACEIAGLCRLLLWDTDMCQRRSAEELLYIQQLRTSLFSNTNQPIREQSAQPNKESEGGGANNVSEDTTVCDELSSQTSSHDEPSVMRTCVTQDSVSERDATAVDVTEVNDVERPSAQLQQHSDWQTLPVDIKYSEHQVSVELLAQEEGRLQHLCDGSSHGIIVITFH